VEVKSSLEVQANSAENKSMKQKMPAGFRSFGKHFTKMVVCANNSKKSLAPFNASPR